MKYTLLIALFVFSYQAKSSEYTPCTSAEVASNTCFNCGQNCVARVSYENVVQGDGSNKQIGTMVISGTGNMGGWVTAATPWWDIRHSIQNLTVEEGITSVGFNAFYHFEELEHVELPKSLKTIDPGGLEFCYALTNLDLPEGVYLDQEALESSGITSLVIPESSSIHEKALKANNPIETTNQITNIYCSQSNIDQCRAAVAYRGDDVQVTAYEKYGNGYLSGGKFYAYLSDIGTSNNIKKRIYTIDEANKLSGKTNTVKIRYK